MKEGCREGWQKEAMCIKGVQKILWSECPISKLDHFRQLWSILFQDQKRIS